ncbi:CD209 antigen-like protein C [Halichoeres trimaculatus]|uniref:CD209 antigen-like protein C n=1 Tax=Halichoeres trimaculatus TaxID=147232 RepID=UPI003D9F3973
MPRPQSNREGQMSTIQQSSGSSRGSKVTGERVALLVVSALLAAAVIVVCRLAHANIMTENSFQRLKYKLQALKINFTGPFPETYLKCEEGWVLEERNCYYFSTTKSSWSVSRDGCRLKGGDLVKIEHMQEQVFLSLQLSNRMTDPEDMFWIGLTDSDVEGRWLWVDGSLLSTWFWDVRQPDNRLDGDPDGQDCVRMGGEGSFKFWFDRSCKSPQKSICEKPAEQAPLKLT